MVGSSIITDLSSNFGSVFATIITVTGSTLGIIYVQHLKSKQEIKLHQKNELFNKKQHIYSILLQYFFEDMDYAHHLGKDLNWKIGRHIYNEFLLIGSKSAIEAYNEYLVKYDESDKTQKMVLIKKVITEIRRDLYDDKLDENKIKFFHPSEETRQIYDLIGSHRSTFESLKLFDLESLSLMNVSEISEKTSISVEQLERMKETAMSEMKLEVEFQNFLEKYYSKLKL